MQEETIYSINEFYEYCSTFRKLVIYGAGDVGMMVAEFMEKEGIRFACFCVTGRPERHTLGKYEVRGIDEIINSCGDTGIILAVSRKNAGDMLRLLEEKGIGSFYSEEFLYQLFKKKCKEAVSEISVQNGYIYRVFDTVFSENIMYICCPASIGDTLYTAALVKAYKSEYATVRKVCLVLKKAHGELGALFPAVDEILISDRITEVLERYSLYTQTWNLKNYIYGHFKKSNRLEYDMEYNKEGCRKILLRYGRLVMRLKQSVEPETPTVDRYAEPAEERKNDIVIMPHAKTAKLLPDSFWEKLVRQLRQKGYFVYTNVGSEKEKVIRGTKMMKESLLDTACLCENCRAVISLRSGLCDLLGFMNAKLIVINTSAELFAEWNLKDVFTREEIYNINCFDSGSCEQAIGRIMTIVG